MRQGQPPFGAGLNAEPLLEQRIVAVASPRLIADKGLPDSFEALQGFVWLHDAHGFWPQFTATLYPGHAPASARHMRFNQTALAIEAAVNGQGICLASHAFVAADLVAGRLVQVFAEQLRLDKAFYLVWPRKPRQPATLQRVKAWLLQQVADS